MKNFDISALKIGVLGLGYVGLPIAVEFAKHCAVVGMDVSAERIADLNTGHDATLEVSDEELNSATNLLLTSSADDLSDCNVYIITVPTPIDRYKKPDLTPLKFASEMVGKCIKNGDVVIYESTVYPGATEEDCIPVIEDVSGLKFNVDFTVGYSPERISPGDRNRGLKDVVKVTSGSNDDTADFVDALYSTIITAGTHKASSIKVAEASKVIENTQRDVNIALINEISIICDRLGINTLDVLDAAKTKWNFIPLEPGLVGGHCIGVDPYYLANKAQSVGYYPEIVLAGRRVNDGMAVHICTRLIREMIAQDIKVKGARVLVLGVTFKENCADLRNSKVKDLVDELESYDVLVDVNDPWADATKVKNEFGITLIEPGEKTYDAIVLAVAHNEYREASFETVNGYGINAPLIFDLKGIFRNQTELPHERIHTL